MDETVTSRVVTDLKRMGTDQAAMIFKNYAADNGPETTVALLNALLPPYFTILRDPADISGERRVYRGIEMMTLTDYEMIAHTDHRPPERNENPQGEILVRGTSGWQRLQPGQSGQVLSGDVQWIQHTPNHIRLRVSFRVRENWSEVDE